MGTPSQLGQRPLSAAERQYVRPRREKPLIISKFAAGAVAAIVVFVVGNLPLRFIELDPHAYQLRPGLLWSELLASSLVLSPLCLICSPVRRSLLQGMGVGVLAGFLVSLHDQLAIWKAPIAGSEAVIPVLLTTEVWHFTEWGVAGAAVSWAHGRVTRKAAA